MSDAAQLLGRAPFSWGFPIDFIAGAGDGLIVVRAQGDLVVFDALTGQTVFTQGVTHSSHLKDRDLVLASAVDDSCTHVLTARLDGTLELFDLPHYNPCWQVHDMSRAQPWPAGETQPASFERLNELVAIALSPDGNLAAATSGSEVGLWQEGQSVARLAGGAPLIFSFDGSLLLAGGVLYDVDAGVRVADFDGITEAAAFSLDSTLLARCVWRPEGRVVELWTLATLTRAWSIPLDHAVEALGFSPDAERLAGAGGGHFQLWQTESGTQRETGVFAGRDCFVCHEPFAVFGICPFGQRLLKLDLNDCAVPSPTGHIAPIRALAAQDDLLISGGDDGLLCLWGPTSSEPLRTLDAGGEVERLAILESRLVVEGRTGQLGTAFRRAWTWPGLEPIHDISLPELPTDPSSRQRRAYLPVRDITLELRTVDFESTGLYLISADHGEQRLLHAHRLLTTSADETLVVLTQDQYLSVYDLDRMQVIARIDAGSYQPPFRDQPTCALVTEEREGQRRIFVGGASGGIYCGRFDPRAAACVGLEPIAMVSPHPPFETRRRKYLTIRPDSAAPKPPHH